MTTLSGGETFLASLALALALAEGLSGLSHGRGRFALESLFLDEGFGTLDAETLDVVLQGVETLSTTDRLVGISRTFRNWMIECQAGFMYARQSVEAQLSAVSSCKALPRYLIFSAFPFFFRKVRQTLQFQDSSERVLALLGTRFPNLVSVLLPLLAYICRT